MLKTKSCGKLVHRKQHNQRFLWKKTLDSLFRKQKKGIRAIVPGFINYKYREGELPGHTKPYFEEYKILAAQGVIVANVLLFMCKIRKFLSFLPLSIRQVINENAPVLGSTYETWGPKVCCRGVLRQFCWVRVCVFVGWFFWHEITHFDS